MGFAREAAVASEHPRAGAWPLEPQAKVATALARACAQPQALGWPCRPSNSLHRSQHIPPAGSLPGGIQPFPLLPDELQPQALPLKAPDALSWKRQENFRHNDGSVQIFLFRSLYVTSQKEKSGKRGDHHWCRFSNDQKMSKIISSYQEWGREGATWRYAGPKEAGSPQSLPSPPSWLLPSCLKKPLLQ